MWRVKKSFQQASSCQATGSTLSLHALREACHLLSRAGRQSPRLALTVPHPRVPVSGWPHWIQMWTLRISTVLLSHTEVPPCTAPPQPAQNLLPLLWAD